MLRRVYPRLPGVLEVRSTEDVAHSEQVADFLDRECKIDALLRLDGRITTVCSRVHRVPPDGRPYNTFTLGLGTGPDSNAQYPALRRALDGYGSLRPYYVMEAYVSEACDQLLSVGVIPAEALIKFVSERLFLKDGRWDTYDTDLWIDASQSVCSVAWKHLTGHQLRTWFTGG